MTLEISLETRCCNLLKLKGAFPIKRGQNGEPDDQVLWGNGVHFWLEFKKPPKKGSKAKADVRPGQKVWAKYLKAIGDLHWFVDSFEQMEEIIDTMTTIHGRAAARRDAAFNR